MTLARKINCFVSFSGVDGDERSIRLLIQHLTERLGDKVTFRAYFNERTGSNLQDFMKDELNAADAVMALFTPDYKRKADQAIPSGVYTEFLNIVDRLELGVGGDFLLIPIYWAGPSFNTAAPEYFINYNLARSLPRFKAFGAPGTDAYLPDRIKSQVRGEIEKIVTELSECWDRADPEYFHLKETIEETMLAPSVEDPGEEAEPPPELGSRIDLVMGPKFERTSRQEGEFVQDFNDRFFVKTMAFRSIGDHRNMAFTGRKGSGKTTLLTIYKHRNAARYFSPADSKVNDWNLHYLLGDLTFRPAEGDLSYTAEESRIFDFIWPIFLSLCLVRSLKMSMDIPTGEVIARPRYVQRFEECAGRYDTLFTLSVEIVSDFIQKCIDETPTRSEAVFRSGLVSRINVQACTESLLGAGCAGLLHAVRRDPSKRRFLFCLDRFDTEMQKYRKDLQLQNLSEAERQRRENREVFWIQGLVEMIDSLRMPDAASPNQEFYRAIGPIVDFCVPLPKDRLFEVQKRRRDAVVGDIFEEINWQVYELLTMLRKRLQAIWNIPDSDIDRAVYKGAKDRYFRVLELSQRKMPTAVDISINGNRYSSDLFLNVLRHTFFRPRDILTYFARIILAVEAAHRRGQPLQRSAVARLISQQTWKVVEEEFIGEFSDYFKNIREVMDLFSGGPQLLSYEELVEKLEDVRFEVYGDDDIVAFARKVRMLYEIGFLGVCSAKGHLGDIPRDDYDFFFFNPRIAPAIEKTEVLKRLKFAIHPVFIETLSLDLQAQKPVMMLTWERVSELDDFG